MNRDRFPALAHYLDRLPDGIDSYPETMVKGSLVRGAVESGLLAPTGGQLPAVLDALLVNPPQLNVWLPEVHLNALMTAIYEARFAPSGGIEAYERWVWEQDRRILRSPLYRILFMVVSPSRLFVGAQKRWSAFRRGSELRILEHGERQATVSLLHKPHVMTDLSTRSMSIALRAALEACGASEVKIEVTFQTAEQVIYQVRWT